MLFNLSNSFFKAVMMYVVTLAAFLFVSCIGVSGNSKKELYTSRPAYIKDVVMTEVRNNSISLKVYTSEKVDTLFIQYREDQWLYKLRRQFKVSGESPYGFTKISLNSSSTYNYQFRVSESDEWSKVYTYVTLPDMPHVIISGLSDGALKIEWSSIFPDTIDKHQLSYHKVSQADGNWLRNECAVTIEIPKCSGSSFTITPLHKDLYYEIRLRAHTSGGYGEYYYFKVHA